MFCDHLLLGIFGTGHVEWIIVGVIAVMLFGKRLPEVARSAGKSFVEFKRGLQGVEDEVSRATRDVERYSDGTSYYQDDDYEPEDYAAEGSSDPDAPKFEPPTAPPQAD